MLFLLLFIKKDLSKRPLSTASYRSDALSAGFGTVNPVAEASWGQSLRLSS